MGEECEVSSLSKQRGIDDVSEEEPRITCPRCGRLTPEMTYCIHRKARLSEAKEEIPLPTPSKKSKWERLHVYRIVMLSLTIAILVLPLLVVQITQTDSPQPYVFKARIIGKLDETLNGKLQYFLVEHLEGNSNSSLLA